MAETAETTRLLRGGEELEGTLLLPVATPIGPAIAPLPSTLAAVPINNEFDYDTAIAAELVPPPPPPEDAICIPPGGSKNGINTGGSLSCADDSTSRVKSAQHTGLIMADQEMEAIERANRRSKGLSYFSNQEIQLANQVAKQRDRQERLLPVARPKDAAYVDRATTNDDDQYFPETAARVGASQEKEQQKKSDSQQQQKRGEPKQDGYKVGGYEVQEYSFGTSNYETGDYRFSEYKSVYD